MNPFSKTIKNCYFFLIVCYYHAVLENLEKFDN